MKSLRWDMRFIMGVTGAIVLLASLWLLVTSMRYLIMIDRALADDFRIAARFGAYSTGVLGCAVAPWLGAAAVRRLWGSFRGYDIHD